MATHNSRLTPPRWLEQTLLVLLPARDRETVIGDLHETYCADKLPQTGRIHADLWYARQVFSFIPGRLLSGSVPSTALAFVCTFTALAGTWLGVMDLRLKHPGYAGRELIAGTILAEALLTLLALRLRGSTWPRIAPLLGCVPILMLAAKALRGALHDSAHFEGYILLIALALILQATLTIVTLTRRLPPSAPELKPL